jgi:hypothetical protein
VLRLPGKPPSPWSRSRAAHGESPAARDPERPLSIETAAPALDILSRAHDGKIASRAPIPAETAQLNVSAAFALPVEQAIEQGRICRRFVRDR